MRKSNFPNSWEAHSVTLSTRFCKRNQQMGTRDNKLDNDKNYQERNPNEALLMCNTTDMHVLECKCVELHMVCVFYVQAG